MSNLGVMELPQLYTKPSLLAFMRPQGPHMPVTENYVCSPPALTVRDNDGSVFTLGFDYDEREWRTGRWEYDIVRNGEKTGEFGRIIERRQGRVRIWGADGWRTWNGRCFV